MPRSPRSAKQLVILIHGIRTQAEWMPVLANLLESPNIAVVQLGYQYFPVHRFLWPIWTREAPIKRVEGLIRTAIADHPGCELSVVAHSFGTYVFTEIMRRNPDIRIKRLIFCGSVVPASFEWQSLPAFATLGTIAINECGARDIWPIIAHSVTWGYGSSGSFGFKHPKFRDRYHDCTHSDFFRKEFMRDFWCSFIKNGEIRKTKYDAKQRPTTPIGLSLLTVFHIRYAVLLLIAFVALWLGWPAAKWAYHVYQCGHAPNIQVEVQIARGDDDQTLDVVYKSTNLSALAEGHSAYIQFSTAEDFGKANIILTQKLPAVNGTTDEAPKITKIFYRVLVKDRKNEICHTLEHKHLELTE